MVLIIEHYIKIFLILIFISVNGCVSIGSKDFNPVGSLVKYLVKKK